MRPLTRSLGRVAKFAIWAAGVRIIATVTGDRNVLESPASVECPRDCDALFGKQTAGPEGEGKVQNVEVQVRGEPKSGTGMMAEWSWGALANACLYLQKVYGEKSCEIVWEMPREIPKVPANPHKIVFERRRAAGDEGAPCSCDTIDRVEILLSAVLKHKLPVGAECHWYHKRGISKPGNAACTRQDGVIVQNQVPPARAVGYKPYHPIDHWRQGVDSDIVFCQADLWKCVEEAQCSYNDDRLQMAVLRDPRAVTVSAYFQLLRQESPRIDEERKAFKSVDAFFQSHLRFVCMWISIRYLLFTVFMADSSAVFWYEEAIADPVDWHRRYLAFVGVHLPPDEVIGMARIASGGGSILGYPSKGLDAHLGGLQEEATTTARTFRDELSEESLAMMDDVLRQWLPPVILARLDLAS